MELLEMIATMTIMVFAFVTALVVILVTSKQCGLLTVDEEEPPKKRQVVKPPTTNTGSGSGIGMACLCAAVAVAATTAVVVANRNSEAKKTAGTTDVVKKTADAANGAGTALTAEPVETKLPEEERKNN
jgi:hypothetical protein